MSDIRLSKDMIGNKVRCVNKIDIHYPEQGTIGTIVAYDEHDAICNYKVQWPKGSTVGNDRWWAMNKCVELVKDDVTTSQKTTDMTNEEIWEMLRPKMEKNGLTSNIYLCTKVDDNGFPCFFLEEAYKNKDVHNTIALAYKVGYLRSQKGRPFKIGEKKKKNGHWEPVDPNNLPKEGTRVRYSRPICFEDEFYLIGWNVGDEGIVNYQGNYFGVKREGKNWDGVGMFGYYFDMWVEDDE